MGTVYSQRLATISPTTGSQSVEAGPPDGYIWVLRQIMATNLLPDIPYRTLIGVFASIGSGPILLRCDSSVITWQSHILWEGRIVIEPGDYLSMATADDYWSMSADGYQLTLP